MTKLSVKSLKLISAIMLLLCSCNHDVFMKDNSPSTQAITLDGNGEEVMATYSTRGLYGIKARVVYGIDYYDIITYDHQGSVITDNEAPVEEIGSIAITSPTVNLTMKFDNGKLSVSCSENFAPFDIGYSLKFIYGEHDYSITIIVTPSGKSVFKSYSYDWSTLNVTAPRVAYENTVTYDNNSDSPMTVTVYPYQKVQAKVTFWTEENYDFPPNIKLEFPTLNGDKAGLYGHVANFQPSITQTFIPSGAGSSVILIIPPHTSNRYTIKVMASSIGIICNLTFENPDTGTEHTVETRCSVTQPVSHEIIVEDSIEL